MDTTPQSELLAEIEVFLREWEMPPSTFGVLAVNDGKLVQRLRCEANITTKTIKRAREFIRSRRSDEAA